MTREREDRVRPRMDVIVDRATEMHAEKWKRRVGHGIDEAAHDRGTLRLEVEVFAAKGHDANLRIGPGDTRDAIRVQTRAIHEEARARVAGGAVDANRVALRDDAVHSRADYDVSAERARLHAIRFGDGAIIDDAGVRYPESGDA